MSVEVRHAGDVVGKALPRFGHARRAYRSGTVVYATIRARGMMTTGTGGRTSPRAWPRRRFVASQRFSAAGTDEKGGPGEPTGVSRRPRRRRSPPDRPRAVEGMYRAAVAPVEVS